MDRSKVIELLSTFNEGQLVRLRAFGKAELTGKPDKVMRLLDILVAARKRGNRYPTREVAFRQLFPNNPFSEKRLSYVMTDLLHLVERYIISQEALSEELRNRLRLLRYYDSARLEKHYAEVMRETEKLMEGNPYQDASRYFNEFLLHEIRNHHFDRLKERRHDESLQKAIDNLDIYYLIIKLKHSCEIVNRQRFSSSTYDLRFINEIIQYLETHPHEQVPAIACYYHIYRMLTEPEKETWFRGLRKLLDIHSTSFPATEAKDMYDYALNYCIIRINEGKQEFLNEVFNIYQTLLEKELLFTEKTLSPWSFKNIVVVALRLKEYKWAEDFIEKYKGRISPEFRANAYAYNRAYVHFHRRQYEQALLMLQSVVFTDIYYSLDTRSLMLKIYFELHEVEALRSHISAFRLFLKRNKLVSDSMRTVYLNQIKFIQRILRLEPRDPAARERLKADLAVTPQIADKSWVEEKVAEA
jgi:hypothetical protein